MPGKMNRLWNKSGFSLVFVALTLVVLLSFTALAIDIGHLAVVRNELQTAADAAALSGASKLYPRTTSGAGNFPPTPDWDAATRAASTNAPANTSDKTVLTNYDVETGYWNLSHTPSGLQSTGISPGPKDMPAVQVTVRRAAGSNSGPVRNFFASIFGMSTTDASAMATAICSYPGYVNPGGLFPLVINKSVADEAGDYNSSVKTVQIKSQYHAGDLEAGQWTSFQTGKNDVTTMRDLIANGNPTQLKIGDKIWVEPGTKTTLFDEVPTGVDVVLPVVNEIDTHANVPIIGFVGFHITSAKGASEKYIEGYFIDNLYVGNSGPVGPYYGTYTPARLVQ